MIEPELIAAVINNEIKRRGQNAKEMAKKHRNWLRKIENGRYAALMRKRRLRSQDLLSGGKTDNAAIQNRNAR